MVEWFLASVSILVVVTLIYVYVLNKSPPPEGETVAKIERNQFESVQSEDEGLSISTARHALETREYGKTIEYSVHASTSTLGNLVRKMGGDPLDMNVSDLAYLVQSKAKNAPQIAQPMYELNSLRLKVAQGHSATQQEAEWSLSIASWLAQVVQTQEITF